jgi:2-desacetyl-2-hydroxyethyl bacteriochlorophyllide A dehydrogenase
MQAMVLRTPGNLVLEEFEVPSGGADRVLVKVTHSGVCGTDLKIYNGSIPVGYPRIMGHEVVGEVADSANDADFKSGDRVLLDPMVCCGTCFHCRSGQSNLCPHGVVLGRDANGGFAEYIAAPPANIFHLPSEIDSSTAPLIQVLSTCLHAQRLTPLFPGESAVVLGLGVTGQLHIQLAKARGSSPILGITRSAFKGQVAQRLGADLTFAPGEGAIAKVLHATSGRGADLIIETTGRTEALAEAIHMARPGGRILLFGINTAKEGHLPFYQLYFKELSLINARAANGEDYAASIDLVLKKAIRLEPLVTHRFPLHQLQRGIELIDSSLDERLKVILEH